jgi:hypothetical protein
VSLGRQHPFARGSARQPPWPALVKSARPFEHLTFGRCERGLRARNREARIYLRIVRDYLEELSQDCERLGCKLVDLPQMLGRPESSVTKLIDEYFWVTISRKCPVPDESELMRWASWW